MTPTNVKAAARVQLATARDTTKQKGNLMSQCTRRRASYSLWRDLTKTLTTTITRRYRTEVAR